MDEHKKEIANGYTLYLNFHLGYQFKFLKIGSFLNQLLDVVIGL